MQRDDERACFYSQLIPSLRPSAFIPAAFFAAALVRLLRPEQFRAGNVAIALVAD